MRHKTRLIGKESLADEYIHMAVFNMIKRTLKRKKCVSTRSEAKEIVMEKTFREHFGPEVRIALIDDKQEQFDVCVAKRSAVNLNRFEYLGKGTTVGLTAKGHYYRRIK